MNSRQKTEPPHAPHAEFSLTRQLSPIGTVRIVERGGHIVRLDLGPAAPFEPLTDVAEQETPLLSVERVAFTYNDAPMELRRGLYRTDTHHYHNALN